MAIVNYELGTSGMFGGFFQENERLDLHSFTRYDLPTADQYRFPAPEPTSYVYTPIIPNPIPDPPPLIMPMPGKPGERVYPAPSTPEERAYPVP